MKSLIRIAAGLVKRPLAQLLLSTGKEVFGRLQVRGSVIRSSGLFGNRNRLPCIAHFLHRRCRLASKQAAACDKQAKLYNFE